MPDQGAISRAIAFLETHGYALLFFWVFVEQSAIPLPSFPVLVAAGALIRTGRLHALGVSTSCLIAAVIADTVWFQLGRRRGGQVLRLLCRISLEPDSCVRQTEKHF
jgi:membrane protein DedA with SNARE-associated domain